MDPWILGRVRGSLRPGFGICDSPEGIRYIVGACYMIAHITHVAAKSCDVTGTQGSGIPAGIGADSRKFRLWTGIPGIRDCRRLFRSAVLSRGTPGVHGTLKTKLAGPEWPGI